MNRTGIVSDPLYIKHDPGPGHPESPDRLRSVYSLIEQEGLMELIQEVAARPASQEEICRVHAPEYYQQILESEGQSVMLDPDTATSADSYRAAELAAGGTEVLVEQVGQGQLDNGYALVRPPGHHAEHARAMGFCLFNNVAVAAEQAIAFCKMDKVLIVDWDLHHGNGTMHSFYDRPEVLYFSTHQYPYYPGTGAAEDVGTGKGEGKTVNVPLVPGMGDQEFRAIFNQVLAPLVSGFSPDIILVSTGFDTYRRDPLGGMKMTAEGYGALTWDLMQMANQTCAGKLVFVLEGGYHLDGLSRGIAYCIKALLGQYEPEVFSGEPGRAKAIIEAVQQIQSRFFEF
ncbi:MAG: histone deacetylase [Deltaproteobacteria bacterium]|nr:histone deacetylase [Deltaproteobacteria bacterium]